MEREEFIEIFERNHDEYLKFDKISDKPYDSPDLCAFHMIYQFLKKEYRHKDIIGAAEHDEIYLCDLDELDLTNLTEDVIIYLIRCGVRYSEDFGSFCMFV